MKREYSGTVKNNVNLFVGTEVEKTIAYEKRTLFSNFNNQLDFSLKNQF